ncbi:hypothetical protein Gohar_006571 [Gossypium harknessii]|uniref:Uncharacterized protein n=1 Tax=Gossypium harknessii TaxID=34285 RepID=A0A7J9GDU3_9ROSI|nr:hypothetical protein [Gossypium harknessii]
MTKLECENKDELKAQYFVCKPFLTILNSCLMSMLRTLNPHLPL